MICGDAVHCGFMSWCQGLNGVQPPEGWVTISRRGKWACSSGQQGLGLFNAHIGCLGQIIFSDDSEIEAFCASHCKELPRFGADAFLVVVVDSFYCEMIVSSGTKPIGPHCAEKL